MNVTWKLDPMPLTPQNQRKHQDEYHDQPAESELSASIA
jgi:hypothetical protein